MHYGVSKEMKTLSEFPRSLSSEEEAITRKMLELATCETTDLLLQLKTAEVLEECGCGCPSVDFSISGQLPPDVNMTVIANFTYGFPKQLCGAFVFTCDDQLAGIEFFPLAAETVPSEIPHPDALTLINY